MTLQRKIPKGYRRLDAKAYIRIDSLIKDKLTGQFRQPKISELGRVRDRLVIAPEIRK